MPEKIVEVRSLTKIYSKRTFLSTTRVLALDGLTLEIFKGDCFGLLGPNGAGKSTTLNIISGLLKPTSGQIKVFSQEIKAIKKSLNWQIGYLPEENALPEHLSLEDLLHFLSNIFSLPKEMARERINWLIEHFDIGDSLKKNIQQLSSGKKRAVGLACALINDPQLLVLDEPTVYLDPIEVRHLRQIIMELKQKGKTIILSSHVLSEIEKLCNRIAILKQGRLKFVGESHALIDKASLDEVFVQLISD